MPQSSQTANTARRHPAPKPNPCVPSWADGSPADTSPATRPTRSRAPTSMSGFRVTATVYEWPETFGTGG